MASRAPPALRRGHEALVRYQIPGIVDWHVRLLLAHVGGDLWVVMSPDLGVFVEKLSLTNQDLAAVRFREGPDSTPLGVAEEDIYGFDAYPSAAELKQLFFEGEAMASAERSRLGWGSPSAGGRGASLPRQAADAEPPGRPGAGSEERRAAGAGAAGAGSRQDGLSGLVQALGSGATGCSGDLRPLVGDAGAGSGGAARAPDLAASALDFSRALGGGDRDVDADVGLGGGSDARKLSVLFDEQGRRHRCFQSSMERCKEDSWSDWPVRDPRTAAWTLRFIESVHRTPTNHHTTWRSLCRLGPHDAGVSEHKTICRALEAAACYDQCNIFNSGAVEVLIRKLQLIEEKHRDRLLQNQGHQDYGDDAHLYLGGSGPRGGAAVCPALQTWIAEELSRESAVLKEKRKAREERSLARPKGGAKGSHPGCGDGK